MMDTRRKAVFFDRDGVLNEDDGYVHQMRKLRWVKGAREIVAELTKAGFLLFVVYASLPAWPLFPSGLVWF